MTRRRGRQHHSSPKPPAISAEQREVVLKSVREGLDPEAALAAANLDEEIARSDAALMAQVAKAFKLATAKLRAKLIARAVDDGESHILERAVAARDAAAQDYKVFLDRPEDDADEAGVRERLDQLSDDELRLLQWASGGLGEPRPAPLMTYWDWEWQHRQREQAEAAAREAAKPAPEPEPERPAALDQRWEIVDQAVPLPPSRSLTAFQASMIVRRS